MPGCMLESLRLYPIGIGGVTERVCVKDYHLKGAGITVRKGTVILVPYQVTAVCQIGTPLMDRKSIPCHGDFAMLSWYHNFFK